MTPVILSFACGVLFLQLQPELPSPAWFGVSALVFLSRFRIFRLPAAFAIGLCWALFMAHLKLAEGQGAELLWRDATELPVPKFLK